MKYKKSIFSLLVLFLLLAAPYFGFTQAACGLETGYILGFKNKNIALGDARFKTNEANGYVLRFYGSYRFEKAKTEIISKIAFKQLFISGQSDELSFSGNTQKIVFSLGGRYFFSTKLSAALFWELENNVDLVYFRTKAHDQLRQQINIQADYLVSSRFSVFAAFSAAFYPIYDYYLVYNPQYQMSVGLAYKICRS